MSPKKCKKCGKETDNLYAGEYCNDCYGVIWDAGFESTSDWGAKVAHSDFVGDLNDVIHDQAKAVVILKKIDDYFEHGEWYCNDCGTTIISVEQQEGMDIIGLYNSLNSGCPKCKKQQILSHDFRGEK